MVYTQIIRQYTYKKSKSREVFAFQILVILPPNGLQWKPSITIITTIITTMSEHFGLSLGCSKLCLGVFDIRGFIVMWCVGMYLTLSQYKAYTISVHGLYYPRTRPVYIFTVSITICGNKLGIALYSSSPCRDWRHNVPTIKPQASCFRVGPCETPTTDNYFRSITSVN